MENRIIQRSSIENKQIKEKNWKRQTIIRHRNCKYRYRIQKYYICDSSSLILRSYTAEEIEYILGYSEKDLPKMVFLSSDEI